MNPVFYPAIGALVILLVDLLGSSAAPATLGPRTAALAGIRLGLLAAAPLALVPVALLWGGARYEDTTLALDAFGLFGLGFVVLSSALVLALSLTHFGMARCRPAEPLALLLLSCSGAMAAIVSQDLLVVFVAIELCWLPLIALIALDSRRLSSSESSLKALFAHVFASLLFAHGLAFLYSATGRLDLAALEIAVLEGGRDPALVLGVALVLVGVIARAAIAPFHTWAPDVHEGAPSFVAAQLSTVALGVSFFVLLRLLHALPDPLLDAPGGLAARLPDLLTALGLLAVLLGHAMALVQVGLRRLVGWLVVGQVGFLALALVQAHGAGADALLLGVIATGAATTGVMATLSSLSHHVRACESLGDLAGMVEASPVRAAFLALFLLSLGGLPGTVGFVARFRILAALEPADARLVLALALAGSVLALAAVGRPLLAMLRPDDVAAHGSRALSNEQFVLGVCAGLVLALGVLPVLGETNLAGQLSIWIERAVASLRA